MLTDVVLGLWRLMGGIVDGLALDNRAAWSVVVVWALLSFFVSACKTSQIVWTPKQWILCARKMSGCVTCKCQDYRGDRFTFALVPRCCPKGRHQRSWILGCRN